MAFVPINFVNAPAGWRQGDPLPPGATPLDATALIAIQQHLADYVEVSGASGGLGVLPTLTADTFQPYKTILLSDGTVRAVPVDADAPAIPTGLAVSARLSSVLLTWTAAARASTYVVYRGGVEVARVTGTSYRDLNITTGSTYLYSVQSVDQYGQRSSITSTVSAFIDPSLNVAPTVSVKAYPPTLPTNGKTILRVNARDANAQSLALSLLVDAGSITPTSDPSVWIYTP